VSVSNGPIRSIGLSARCRPSACVSRAPAPTLGQHTREVLAELGYGEAEVAAMIAEGAAA